MKKTYISPKTINIEIPTRTSIAQTSVRIYQKPADESEAEVKEEGLFQGKDIWEEW